jgi:hypothetical protein
VIPVSKRGRIAVAVVVVLTVAAEVAALAVYRHSADGQTPVLWVAILIYGAIAVGVVRIADGWLQRGRQGRR